MKRDKQRVEGEQWSDEQLRSYLDFNTYDGSDRDFHCLYRAYTRMNAHMFEQFIELFKAEGRNLEATNKEGVTLKALIEGHAKSGDYVAALSA
jgi:hypothetical protein